jgi:hypothetical protein
MNIARLSALLFFTLMLIPIGASAHCKGKHDVPGHEHCEPGDPTDPGDSVTYVATLTGAFAFDTENNPVIVTANKQGKVLKGESSVTLSRPDDTIPRKIWDSVFEECYNFFGPTPVNVSGFKAPAGNKGWTIEKAGGVRVNFRLRFSQEDLPGVSLIPDSVWVALSLIGDRDFDETFPPPDTIQLSHFTIHGQTESGVTPRLACANENFALVDFPILPPIYLTITPTNTE